MGEEKIYRIVGFVIFHFRSDSAMRIVLGEIGVSAVVVGLD
jgi:hypothetical protein